MKVPIFILISISICVSNGYDHKISTDTGRDSGFIQITSPLFHVPVNDLIFYIYILIFVSQTNGFDGVANRF